MKLNDSLPSRTAVAMPSLQQHRHRLAAVRNQRQEHPATRDTGASVPNPRPESMIIKPIVLSRRRRPGSGMDRLQLAALLDEALAISMNVNIEDDATTEETGNDRSKVKK
jgi:hypothetical protein